MTTYVCICVWIFFDGTIIHSQNMARIQRLRYTKLKKKALSLTAFLLYYTVTEEVW
jgi:hypothetical protein